MKRDNSRRRSHRRRTPAGGWPGARTRGGPPRRLPCAPRAAQRSDPRRGAQVYLENCASCHGARGDWQWTSGKGLDPAPIDFTDAGRARKRSLFALYQVIGQGLEGTSMPSLPICPSDDRWAVAAYAGGFAFRDTGWPACLEPDPCGARAGPRPASLHESQPGSAWSWAGIGAGRRAYRLFALRSPSIDNRFARDACGCP